MTGKSIIHCLILIVLAGSPLLLKGEAGRFKAEFSGRFLFVNPGHLNHLQESERQFLAVYLDPVYEGKRETGSMDPFRSLSAIQSRIKLAVTPAIDISLGLSYIWGIQTNNLNVHYSRNEDWRVLNDTVDYRDMKTRISGIIPSAGLHIRLPLIPGENLRLSVTGGPLFAAIDYSNNLTQSITNDYDSSVPIWSSEKNTTMEGTGNGISLTGSITYLKKISGSMGIFFEGGYTYQRVTGIGGAGSETINGTRSDFSGEWGLVTENVITGGSETAFVFPTNNWEAFGEKQEDFILDLSGVFLTAGISIRF